MQNNSKLKNLDRKNINKLANALIDLACLEYNLEMLRTEKEGFQYPYANYVEYMIYSDNRYYVVKDLIFDEFEEEEASTDIIEEEDLMKIVEANLKIAESYQLSNEVQKYYENVRNFFILEDKGEDTIYNLVIYKNDFHNSENCYSWQINEVSGLDKLEEEIFDIISDNEYGREYIELDEEEKTDIQKYITQAKKCLNNGASEICILFDNDWYKSEITINIIKKEQ